MIHSGSDRFANSINSKWKIAAAGYELGSYSPVTNPSPNPNPKPSSINESAPEHS